MKLRNPRTLAVVLLLLFGATLMRLWKQSQVYSDDSTAWSDEIDRVKLENARLRGSVRVFESLAKADYVPEAAAVPWGPAADIHAVLLGMKDEREYRLLLNSAVDFRILVSAHTIFFHGKEREMSELERCKEAIQSSMLSKDQKTLLWDIVLSREAILRDFQPEDSERKAKLTARASARESIARHFIESDTITASLLAGFGDVLPPEERACYLAGQKGSAPRPLSR